jgi:2-phospho-L-lactate guanylyltransferase
MYILIPCKSLANGKSRLSSCLTTQARCHFCTDLLTHTLEAALGVIAPAQIRVVTSDRAAIKIADSYSVGHLPDRGAGLNAALEAARIHVLSAEPNGSALILPIDLPYVSADAITAAAAHKGDIIIAADQRGAGTNLLLLRNMPLAKFRFYYGADSYVAHLAQARDQNFSVAEVHDERLAFDIDEPEQYAMWHSQTVSLSGSMAVARTTPRDR